MRICLLICFVACSASPTEESPGDCLGEKDNMALIRGGRFALGCPAGTAECSQPEYEVELQDFAIDLVEVTFRDIWPDCQEDPGCLLPVDAQNYGVGKFSCESLGKRLPSWSEWEVAFRGSQLSLYPWGNAASPEQLQSLTTDQPLPVGSQPLDETSCGIKDMAGGLAEAVGPEKPGVAEPPLPDVVPGQYPSLARGGTYSWPSRFDMLYYDKDPSRYVGVRCALDLSN